MENKFILAIDWSKVETHMAAVKANPLRIKLGRSSAQDFLQFHPVFIILGTLNNSYG